MPIFSSFGAGASKNFGLTKGSLRRKFGLYIIDSTPTSANTGSITIPPLISNLTFVGVASGANSGIGGSGPGGPGGRGGEVQLSGYTISVEQGQVYNYNVSSNGANITVSLDGGATVFELRGGSYSSPSLPSYATGTGGAGAPGGARVPAGIAGYNVGQTGGSGAPNPSGTGGGGGGGGGGDSTEPGAIVGRAGGGSGGGSGVYANVVFENVDLTTIPSSYVLPNGDVVITFTGAAGGAPQTSVPWATRGRTNSPAALGGFAGGAGGGIYVNISPAGSANTQAFGGGGGGYGGFAVGPDPERVGQGGAGILIVNLKP